MALNLYNFSITFFSCSSLPKNQSDIFHLIGLDHGIIRMSLATEPDPDVKKTVPGMGLKFLRDGIDSGNLVAMFSLQGQESWNFFKNDFSNHIPLSATPQQVPLVLQFATATKYIQQVGLSNLAM